MNQSIHSLLVVSFSIALATAPRISKAASPLGGLTVAVSPDGSRLVVAGDSRTLYSLDPDSLEITERTWIGTTVVDLAFSSDGTILAVADTSDEVRFYDTTDFSLKSTTDKLEKPSLSTPADLVAGWSRRADAVLLHAMADGAQKLSIPIAEKVGVDAIGISVDGSRVAILESSVDTDKEEKVGYSDIPKDLQGLDRAKFELENDGKSRRLAVYDGASGELVREHELWYSPNGSLTLAMKGEEVVVMNYSNDNAVIAEDGSVELFAMPNSFNYGAGFSNDRSKVFGGSLADGSIRNLEDGQSLLFKIDKLPGWPEYFKGFSAADDGTLFGATTGFRVIKISPDGTIAAQVPVN